MAKAPKVVEIITTGNEAQVARDYADALEVAATRPVTDEPHMTNGPEPRAAGTRTDRRIPPAHRPKVIL